MSATLHQLTLEEWDQHYAKQARQGLPEPSYGCPLSRHVGQDSDLRLRQLLFDPSPAALRLWSFLLTENERLRAARARGDTVAPSEDRPATDGADGLYALT